MSYLLHLECFRCRRQYPPGRLFQGCPACGPDRPSNVYCVYDYGRLAGVFGPGKLDGRPLTMWRYRELLPVADGPAVTLDEGMTPARPLPAARRALRAPAALREGRVPEPDVVLQGSDGVGRRDQGAGARRHGPHDRLDRQRRRGHRGLCRARRPPRGDPDDAERAGGHAALHAGVRRHGGRGPHARRPVDAGPGGRRAARLVPGAELRDAARRSQSLLARRRQDRRVRAVRAARLAGARRRRGPRVLRRPPGRDVASVPRAPGARARRPRAPHDGGRGVRPGRERAGPRPGSPEPMPGGRSVATSAAATNSAYQSLRMVRDTGGVALTATDDEIMGAQLELAETEGIWAEPAAALPLAVARKLAAQRDRRRPTRWWWRWSRRRASRIPRRPPPACRRSRSSSRPSPRSSACSTRRRGDDRDGCRRGDSDVQGGAQLAGRVRAPRSGHRGDRPRRAARLSLGLGKRPHHGPAVRARALSRSAQLLRAPDRARRRGRRHPSASGWPRPRSSCRSGSPCTSPSRSRRSTASPVAA